MKKLVKNNIGLSNLSYLVVFLYSTNMTYVLRINLTNDYYYYAINR